MKKLVFSFVLVGVLLVTGCTAVTEKGDYKEGTYFGYVEEEHEGTVSVVTSVVYVNENGMIKSVYVDATYDKDGKLTTKKALGDAYGMKSASANMGVIPGGAEWDEQVKNFEDKVVKEQGLDWLTWKDDAQVKTDSVSGVTIAVGSIYAAVNSALEQAK